MIRKFIVQFIFGLFLPVISFATSYHFQNQDIAKNVVLEETGDVLTLRGVGVHKKFFQDSYMAAFYSLNKMASPQQAITDGGAKRIWIHALNPITDLKQQWLTALIQNNSPEIMEREQINVSHFLKIIDVPLQSGDTIAFDYIPNIGTKILIKGSVRGIIKGNDFFKLILKIWMGRQPPSEKFRKDLFKLSPEGIHL